VRQADELGQGHTRLVTAQSVQVDLALDGPVALAQFMRHVRADARAAKTQGLVGVQQGADIEFIAQGVAQHRRVVFLALLGHRRSRHLWQTGLLAIGQGLDHPHRPRKQIARCLGLPCLRLQRSLLGLGTLMGCLEFFLDFLEVLQRVEFHAPPRLRIQSAV